MVRFDVLPHTLYILTDDNFGTKDRLVSLLRIFQPLVVVLGNPGNEVGVRHAMASTGADALADLMGPDFRALKAEREEGAGEDAPVVPDMSTHSGTTELSFVMNLNEGFR